MQVIIYLDSPNGQLMQISYADYKYWRSIGWRILCKAPEFSNMPSEKLAGVQLGLRTIVSNNEEVK